MNSETAAYNNCYLNIYSFVLNLTKIRIQEFTNKRLSLNYDALYFSEIKLIIKTLILNQDFRLPSLLSRESM